MLLMARNPMADSLLQSVLLLMAMGFLAIYSHTGCTRESSMGFLSNCTHRDLARESALEFLAISSHTDCTRESTWVPGRQEPHSGLPGAVSIAADHQEPH